MKWQHALVRSEGPRFGSASYPVSSRRNRCPGNKHSSFGCVAILSAWIITVVSISASKLDYCDLQPEMREQRGVPDAWERTRQAEMVAAEDHARVASSNVVHTTARLQRSKKKMEAWQVG
ncbi:hypothetical protein LY76DRAFT_165955 [Colletotrichum caudatum]|nr:hypothetical protein LY76DRAFT_165955 [Colletotrichum caudatum]